MSPQPDKDYESVLAGLADCINTELRESCADQIRDWNVDMRPFIRKLVDNAKETMKDAARYRWLRARKHTDIAACWLFEPHDEVPEKADELDAAIDRKLAAIADAKTI